MIRIERTYTMRYRIVRALLLTFTLPVIASSAFAQRAVDSVGVRAPMWERAAGCAASAGATDETRQLVLLEARMAPQTAKPFITQSELLAKEVNVQLRTMLGGSESTLPNAPSGTLWRAVPAELVVVARSDGSMSWRGFSASGDTAAVTLLSAALDSARHHGGALMLWPEDHAADSIDFRLSLLPENFGAARGFDSTYKGEMRFRAFAMLTPKLVPALPVKNSGDIVYPKNNAFLQVTGQVIVEFVVDTTGHAVISTFHDVWPANKPRPTGPFGDYYDEFVDSIRSYAAKAKFTPASIGGCPVLQWVRLPVNFQGPQ